MAICHFTPGANPSGTAVAAGAYCTSDFATAIVVEVGVRELWRRVGTTVDEIVELVTELAETVLRGPL